MGVRLGLIGILVFLSINMAEASSLYRWRDSDGVLHFSNVAPSQGARTFDEFDDSGKKTAMRSSQKNTSPGRASSVAPGAEDKDAPVGGMSRSVCEETITQTIESADNHIDIARENMVKGHITKAQYDQARDAMMKIKKGLSVTECMEATGKDKEIFECLSDSFGCIICCMKD